MSRPRPGFPLRPNKIFFVSKFNEWSKTITIHDVTPLVLDLYPTIAGNITGPFVNPNPGGSVDSDDDATLAGSDYDDDDDLKKGEKGGELDDEDGLDEDELAAKEAAASCTHKAAAAGKQPKSSFWNPFRRSNPTKDAGVGSSTSAAPRSSSKKDEFDFEAFDAALQNLQKGVGGATLPPPIYIIERRARVVGYTYNVKPGPGLNGLGPASTPYTENGNVAEWRRAYGAGMRSGFDFLHPNQGRLHVDSDWQFRCNLVGCPNTQGTFRRFMAACPPQTHLHNGFSFTWRQESGWNARNAVLKRHLVSDIETPKGQQFDESNNPGLADNQYHKGAGLFQKGSECSSLTAHGRWLPSVWRAAFGVTCPGAALAIDTSGNWRADIEGDVRSLPYSGTQGEVTDPLMAILSYLNLIHQTMMLRAQTH